MCLYLFLQLKHVDRDLDAIAGQDMVQAITQRLDKVENKLDTFAGSKPNIGILISNTRKLKASSGYGTSGTSLVSALRVSKGLPNMSDDGTSRYNSWGGAVTVVSNGMTFTVTENGLPADACVTLATKISRGQKVTTTINAGTAVTGEVLQANATSGCSKDANVVAWTVY